MLSIYTKQWQDHYTCRQKQLGQMQQRDKKDKIKLSDLHITYQCGPA